jgi:hypothetical protein
MRRALIRKPTGKKPQIVRERKLYGNDRINYKRNQRNGKIIGTKQIGADEGGKEIERKHRKITKAKHIPTQRKKSDKNPTNQNPRKENGKDHDPTGSGRTEVARCRASIAGGGASLWPRELLNRGLCWLFAHCGAAVAPTDACCGGAVVAGRKELLGDDISCGAGKRPKETPPSASSSSLRATVSAMPSAPGERRPEVLLCADVRLGKERLRQADPPRR